MTNLAEKIPACAGMTDSLEDKQATAAAWFRQLRDGICASYEQLEQELDGPMKDREVGQFERTAWEKEPLPADRSGKLNAKTEGGGEISLMRGRVFEKVGVNISTVYGEFDEKFRNEIPGAAEDPRYWASGISLVAHQHSPLVPAAHFNTRMICIGGGTRLWFGGGGDLNPMYPLEQDTQDFHNAFKDACDPYDPAFYPTFKAWCDEYFYIPHRNMARGVGGIFYDYLGLNGLGTDHSPVTSGRFGKGGADGKHTASGMALAADTGMGWEPCFAFTQAVGCAFRDIYPELIRRHMNKEWTDDQREWQLQKRGWYAEYNLLYDRGTRFGLMTGGNTEAILMSLPPEARWP